MMRCLPFTTVKLAAMQSEADVVITDAAGDTLTLEHRNSGREQGRAAAESGLAGPSPHRECPNSRWFIRPISERTARGRQCAFDKHRPVRYTSGHTTPPFFWTGCPMRKLP